MEKNMMGYYRHLAGTDGVDVVKEVPASGLCAFLLCIRGEMRLSIDAREHVLYPASVLTLMPRSLVSEAVCTDEFEGYLVAFPPVMAESSGLNENLLYLTIQTKENPVLSLSERRTALALQYIGLIRELYAQPESATYPVVDGVIHSFLHALHAGYLLNRGAHKGDVTGRKEAIVREFVNLVGIHYMRERRVEFYADKLCITPAYLSAAVRQAYGRTPSFLIDHAVLVAAKAKLQSRRYTVQQVSDSLGFPNPSFFGKFFKRHVGCPPGEWMAGEGA